MSITAHGYDDKHGYYCIDTHPDKTYAQRITGFIFSHQLEEYIALHASSTHPCLSLQGAYEHIEWGVILGNHKLTLRWQRYNKLDTKTCSLCKSTNLYYPDSQQFNRFITPRPFDNTQQCRDCGCIQ